MSPLSLEYTSGVQPAAMNIIILLIISCVVSGKESVHRYRNHKLIRVEQYAKKNKPDIKVDTGDTVSATTQKGHVPTGLNPMIRPMPAPSLTLTKREIDIMKAESKFLPSKAKTDAMYERLKTSMYYKPDVNELTPFGNTEYHMDEDDVRTSSRGAYGSWPYFYHSPYEYERMKVDAELQKAKDKRYAAEVNRIIPIYEDQSDDVPNSYKYIPPISNYYLFTTTDNPMMGHEPFFKYVLHDYFDHSDNDDPLTFKGVEWDQLSEPPATISDARELSKNNRPLEDDTSHQLRQQFPYRKYDENAAYDATEKGYDNNQDCDHHKKGYNNIENSKAGYDLNGERFNGFKEFLDSFATKFGNEDHDKKTSYLLKRNLDKGEKKKGFRRVYHKDEYQEDNEFYDNNNHLAQSEDKGSSKVHTGGSEGGIKSHSVASTGNEASTVNRSGNKQNDNFDNGVQGFDKTKGYQGVFNSYRDVARQAADSNHVDYSDPYRI